MSLYYLILWNQVDILQKHFKKDHVHMRLWTRFYGIGYTTPYRAFWTTSRVSKPNSIWMQKYTCHKFISYKTTSYCAFLTYNGIFHTLNMCVFCEKHVVS